MSYYFTDKEITDLILESKNFNGTVNDILKLKDSDGHKRGSVNINRPDGNLFVIKLRQNKNIINDFSVILAFQRGDLNTDFKLRRYNGKHEHTNKLENEKFFNYHIHYATQRYQDDGRREESYAEETDRYSDLKGALNCLINDCNIQIEVDPQGELFED